MLKSSVFYLFLLGLILILGLGYLFTWILVPGAIGGLIGLTVAFGVIKALGRSNAHKKILQLQGEKAKAEITEVNIQDNITINNNWSPAKLKLNIKTASGSKEGTLKVLISHVRGNPYSPGMEIDVMVLPQNPDIVMLYEDFIAPDKKPSPVIKYISAIFIAGFLFTIILVFPVNLIPGAASGEIKDVVYVKDGKGFGKIWVLENRKMNNRNQENIRVFDVDSKATEKVLTYTVNTPEEFYTQMLPADSTVYFFSQGQGKFCTYMGLGTRSYKKQEDLAGFASRMPEFSAGIYQLIPQQYARPMVFVRTNDGESYYYNYTTDTLDRPGPAEGELFSFKRGTGQKELLTYKRTKVLELNQNEYWDRTNTLLDNRSENEARGVEYELVRRGAQPSDRNERTEYQLTADSVISGNELIISPQTLFANDSLIVFTYKSSIATGEIPTLTLYRYDGTKRWADRDNFYSIVRFQALDNNCLILSSGKAVRAISLETGKKVWEYNSEQFWTFKDKVSYIFRYLGLIK